MDLFRKYLRAYLSGKIDFDTFWEWFAEFSFEAADRFQGADLQLIRDVELCVAEFTSGDMSEPALKADIRKYAGLGSNLTLVYVAPAALPQVTTSASPASLTERRLAFA
jgi:hypothetical protein